MEPIRSILCRCLSKFSLIESRHFLNEGAKLEQPRDNGASFGSG
jgi:hypothetical protein